jgi:hypothetical protein
MVSRPKDLGGLGIHDLEKFRRALHLCWLWQDWVEESKPWAGVELPCNKLDRLLFKASTEVTIGDGEKSRFWHNSWLDGAGPRHLAPHLFDLAKRKNRSVKQELQNNSWIRSLSGQITTAVQIEEFISLWIRFQNIHLTPGIRDSIVWRWTTDDTYSTRLAYRMQFKGSYKGFQSNLMWEAHADNKCKVFAWILVREKSSRRTTCTREDGPIKTIVPCAMDCLR